MSKHYENFPVGSLLIPSALRPAIRAIYAFARTADDIADEGITVTDEERLEQLDALRKDLGRVEQGFSAHHPLIDNLERQALHPHHLPIQPFYDLLKAFEQDISKKRYAHFGEVMMYCRFSAQPVGHIMLHLFGVHERRAYAYSDAICAALQLINFLQDIEIDWQKGRCYLPQNEWEKFGLSEEALTTRECSPAWQRLMHYNIDRARRLLSSGSPLVKELPGRFSWELMFIVLGGNHILQRLHALDRNRVFHERPLIRFRGSCSILWQVIQRQAFSTHPIIPERYEKNY
jgi:squalene synthase HpnC